MQFLNPNGHIACWCNDHNQNSIITQNVRPFEVIEANVYSLIVLLVLCQKTIFISEDIDTLIK